MTIPPLSWPELEALTDFQIDPVEVLRLIPNVGNDTDFERSQDDTAPNVFT